MDRRDELLLKMYETLNNEISRHITIVWQSVSVVIGAFTILSLVEKNIINMDVAIGIILLLIVWLFDHLIDAGYWYNRNLVIIANIERQFLKVTDLQEIHHYFGAHRDGNKMITHLRIQRNLGVGLAILVTCYHFFTRVYPGFSVSLDNFEPVRTIPYIVILLAIFYVPWKISNANKKYKNFVKESPGKYIDDSSVTYGESHPAKK